MATKPPPEAMKYRLDWDRSSLVSNFERRGWTRVTSSDWNVYWASVNSIRQIFSPETHHRLTDAQLVNHFVNHGELTRKDRMVKNIKRYRKQLEMEGHPLAAKDGSGRYIYLDFLPATFSLPSDHPLFVEEFRRHPHSVWIMKPPARSRGIGIFIVNKLSQIKKWSKDKWQHGATAASSYVISRYISDPLLVGGRKFDLRMYVLITRYRPLKAYVSSLGFARFCVSKYSNDINDLFIHLTNVSIQKSHENYSEEHGGKWPLENLRVWVESTRGMEAAKKLWDDMDMVIVQSLKAVQGVMSNDKHCFECYGYDLLLDERLHPWLIEVNASPSLSATTESDRVLKTSLINDVLNVVVSERFGIVKSGMQFQRTIINEEDKQLGSFRLLYDEAVELSAGGPTWVSKDNRRPGSRRAGRRKKI